MKLVCQIEVLNQADNLRQLNLHCCVTWPHGVPTPWEHDCAVLLVGGRRTG